MARVGQKLDKLFYVAFETNHPTMIHWVEIKFELKSLCAKVEELEK